jgi:hypothetical protein
MTAAMVPARPLWQWLIAWTISTQDPPELIARGFDLDEALVVDLLGPEPPRMVDAAVARDVCRNLRIDPPELWRSDIARLVGPCNWPAEALWADVDPHVARFARRL